MKLGIALEEEEEALPEGSPSQAEEGRGRGP